MSELEAELEHTRTEPPPGTEDLSQGADTFDVHLSFETRRPEHYFSKAKYAATIHPSWNEIFAGVAPALINEVSEPDLKKAFRRHFTRLSRQEFEHSEALEGKEIMHFSFRDDEIETCLVQLRALGLIRESARKRSVKDTATYWTLTPYGDRLMVQLRALRRIPLEHRHLAGKVEETKDDDTI